MMADDWDVAVVEEMIDHWYATDDGEQTLQEYLGWGDDEYASWWLHGILPENPIRHPTHPHWGI